MQSVHHICVESQSEESSIIASAPIVTTTIIMDNALLLPFTVLLDEAIRTMLTADDDGDDDDKIEQDDDLMGGVADMYGASLDAHPLLSRDDDEFEAGQNVLWMLILHCYLNSRLSLTGINPHRHHAMKPSKIYVTPVVSAGSSSLDVRVAVVGVTSSPPATTTSTSVVIYMARMHQSM